ncbi:Na+/H+ antiporter subunit E [Geobacter sp. DSM 9736]|uniref:Na+/H+ antiporter subunit E n=1 Tax=Geobacter sp. DSM 9736 TaxID=1277350 RepID=UPI000B506C97|nr:Na+/H+ antiporter subunit E [Geobacter sp. DSM 9736]SNB46892.1 multicomponent Na+:H+ antiporter subunit E [Geobacter sp. DSM 9736]
MRTFLFHILLMLAWIALTGNFTATNMAAGLLLGILVIWVVQKEREGYVTRLGHVAGFLLFFLRELTVANLRVAHDVLTPRHRMRPGILAIPLDLESEAEITFLATLITLTPGTLCLDVTEDRRTLYLHAMYIDDPEKVRRTVKEGYERRVREVFR